MFTYSVVTTIRHKPRAFGPFPMFRSARAWAQDNLNEIRYAIAPTALVRIPIRNTPSIRRYNA